MFIIKKTKRILFLTFLEDRVCFLKLLIKKSKALRNIIKKGFIQTSKDSAHLLTKTFEVFQKRQSLNKYIRLR